MAFISSPLQMPVDGRQSETALAIARGTARLLHAHGRCVVSELPLPSGRRADLVALDPNGELWIVEIKSSIADFVPTRNGRITRRIAIAFSSRLRSMFPAKSSRRTAA